MQRGNARDDETVFLFFNSSAERAQEICRALEAVGLLEPQPVGILDPRLPFCDRRNDAQHGNEVGDGCGVDRHAMQCAALDRHGVVVLRDLRSEPAQNVQHAAVALRGLQIQPLDGHALFRQSAHAEKKCRVRPVSLDDRARRQAELLSAEDGVRTAIFREFDFRQPQRVLRHRDIGRGLKRACHRQGALPREVWQRHEQARDVLRGHVARDLIVARFQPTAAQKQVTVFRKCHAVRRQNTIQRGERALGQPSFAVEHRLRAERADDGQQEAQRRPALAAV